MTYSTTISWLYMLSAFVFPFFYWPQIKMLLKHPESAKFYSFHKATVQLVLRVIAVLYGFDKAMLEIILVVAGDALARAIELSVALYMFKRDNQPETLEVSTVAAEINA